MTNDNLLSNFTKHINVAVVGASGGIGEALVKLLLLQRNINKIYCLSRSKTSYDDQRVQALFIDMTDEVSIENAANDINADQIDIVIIASGVLHGNHYSPEKSLKDLHMDKFNAVFAANTFGPALIAKHFISFLPRDRKSVFASLSARVGSIEDNRLGGWYAYRASKAALNMLIKNIAIETARRYKHACVIGLHPGTVDTQLSQPFQTNVPPEKLFTAEQAANCLLKVINGVTPQQTGKVLAWDGKVIPY